MGDQKKENEDQKVKASVKGLPIVNNILVALIVMILIVKIKDSNEGYKWVQEGLIAANLETIDKYKDLTHKQKIEAKTGSSGRFLNFIKEQTPETAIILMPPDSILLPAKGKPQFDKNIKNKVWCSYFLYPRKVIFERQKETAQLYDSATHVAIMNGWGYEKLTYPVSNKSNFSIMPIKN